jgi:hypothetical protein
MSKELDREAFSNFVRALAFASRKHSQQRRRLTSIILRTHVRFG